MCVCVGGAYTLACFVRVVVLMSAGAGHEHRAEDMSRCVQKMLFHQCSYSRPRVSCLVCTQVQKERRDDAAAAGAAEAAVEEP